MRLKNTTTGEKGKTLFEIIRLLMIIAMIAFTIFFIGRWLYRIAIEDSVVEDTIKELSGRAITASGQLIIGNTLTPGDMGNETRQGYTVSLYTTADNFFEIALHDVPRKICRRMVKRQWGIPTSVYINNRLSQQNQDICRSTNVMAFEFSRDLGPADNADKPYRQACQDDTACSPCQKCQNGLCKNACPAGESCAKTVQGEEICCANANRAGDICCPYIDHDMCCWGRGTCCPMDTPIRLADGTCVSCYDRRVFEVGTPPRLEKCLALCPNRVVFGDGALCQMPLCAENHFTNRQGDCIPCAQAGGFETSPSECAKCPHRVWQKGLCLAPCSTGQIMDSDGRCRSCDDFQSIIPFTHTKCDSACGNRHTTEERCVLNDCPIGTIPDSLGNCVACTTPQNIATTAEKCALCPNRIFQNGLCRIPCPAGQFPTAKGICVSCNTPEAVPVEPHAGSCQRCPNRLALSHVCFATCNPHQFRDAFGTCHDCTDLMSAPILQTAVCATCPNRSVLFRIQNNQKRLLCKWHDCPPHTFMDEAGTCHDCLTTVAVGLVDEKDCLTCPNRMWSIAGKTCRIRPTCPPDEVIASDGTCQSCTGPNIAFNVQGRPEVCDTCSDRYMFGFWCRICPTNIGTLTDKAGCHKCKGRWDNRLRRCLKPALTAGNRLF